MSPEDFEFATSITSKMNWNMAKEDFEFMLELEPEGCFVLSSNSEKIGIATTINYGRIGWFGNLIISENHRNKGAGSLLVEHSLKYLKSKNVETVGLYAYPNKIPFYKRLGFQYDSGFIVLTGKPHPSQSQPQAKKAEKENIPQIIDYDTACFGASRKKLLEPILLDPDNLCYIHTEKGNITGYIVAKIYRRNAELGPLICQQGKSSITLDLLEAILDKTMGLEVSICIPHKESTTLDMLTKSGLAESFHVARMFSGTPLTRECILAAESLERG
jgi:hypothetical protein